jgi:hypothetical protein
VAITEGSITNANNANYDITFVDGTLTINRKALTINSELTSATKVYDGTTTAVITTSSLEGLIEGEDVTATGSGNYDNANVGTGKTITISYTLADGVTAGLASNYSIAPQISNNGIITPRPLTITGITASNKTYNGNTAATIDVDSANFDGLVTIDGVADDVTVSATGTFADKNVGTGKVVTLSETTGGADVANYTITNQGTTTADITPAPLTIGGITAINKTYDGNTTATTDVSRATFTGLVTGDDVTVSATGTFVDKNVGDGKVVSLTETNAGADVANYTITNQGTTTANITKKALTIDSALSSASKVYDGTRTAVVSRSDLVGLVDGEDLIASGGGNYDNANVGTGKTITISYTLADGVTGLASNYSISTQTTNNGIITKAPLTVTAIDDAKFITEPDPTFTFVYNGFVNGETAGALVASGQFVTGNVSRSNSATNAAGTYANVLVPGGFSADNYSINAVNGDFTIVPADQLIVKITPVSNVTYANNPVYDNTTGTHHYTAKYLDGGNNQIKI